MLLRIELERSCFACMLGGEDDKTLFMMTADWRMQSITDNVLWLTGQV